MDTSDPEINFDSKGICNHCKEVEKHYKKLPPLEKREKAISNVIEKIRIEGKNKKYDSLVGVSGGVDSTYVVHFLRTKGLRPLAVHMDNGWNSETAVKNLENLLKKLDVDLYTKVLNWNEFKDLQLAFLKSSILDLEIPTDHAIRAVVMNTAKKFKLKYIINGSNYATESILPRSWSRSQSDWVLIKNIYKQFGHKKRLRKYPHYTLFNMLSEKLYHFNKISLLDNIDYNKTKAIEILQDNYGWQYYGGKHYESVFTRFFQGYILPRKFGIDKRRAHLSSLICSGEITRDEALEEIKKEPYQDQLQLNEDMELFKNKLELTDTEFDKLLHLPNKSVMDYPNYENTFPYSLFYKKYRQKTINNFKRKISAA